MKLRFIGEDGTMGLRHGREYECEIESMGKFIYVVLNCRSKFVAYSSIKKLLENWEDI